MFQLLYTYLRASYGINVTYKIYWQNEVLPDDDTPIALRDVQRSCVMNVDIEMVLIVSFDLHSVYLLWC